MSHQTDIILEPCGGTGSWGRPYREAGYDVRNITLPTDVRLLKFCGRVHGILAAPPCAVFSRAGAWTWPRSDHDMREALSVVDACLRLVVVCQPVWWALENPIGTLQDYLGPPIFKFDPYEFGDLWTKRTWLWGRFVPPVPLISAQARQGLPRAVASSRPGWQRDRTTTLHNAALRAKTPDGFARAFFEANP